MLIFDISNDKKEPLSISKLTSHAIEELNWNFINFPQKNIAIDGLFEIFDLNKQKTGDHIWVEVKTGTSYIKTGDEDSFIIIDLKDKIKVKKWRKIWVNVPGSMIIIFVHYVGDNTSCPVFYWADLKNETSFINNKPTQIKIPIDQKIENDFFLRCKSLVDFRKPNSYNGLIPTISIGIDGFDYMKLNHSLKNDARKQYRKWSRKNEIERTNPKFGVVDITRVGWQHISRSTRKKQRIIQSWQLLTVAEEMIKRVVYSRKIESKPKWKYDEEYNTITFKDYFYLKAKIKFNHRKETIVYVILRKITILSCNDFRTLSSRVWFYTVYEGERGI